jgi:predicted metalloprotease with PDZ domain
VFEGFTSYYDDLFLLRSGVIELKDYLKLVSRTVSNVQRGPGREKQSTAESSFDAWTRFYKQDENAINAIVSYYTKGSMVALAIDLCIRSATRSKKSLDDVMRLMWIRYGRNFETEQQGVGETDMPALIKEATGIDLSRQIRQWAYGTKDIPLARLLKPFGIETKKVGAEKAPVSLGVRLATRNGQCTAAAVYNGRAAHRAGISAGDVIIAVNAMRITSESALNDLLKRYKPGQTIDIAVFRQDILHQFELTLQSPEKSGVELTSKAKSSKAFT